MTHRKHPLETLLVEDQEEVRTSIAEALEDAGYVVTQAVDGEHAMGFLVERRFDLMICDLNLPKVNGLALLRRVKVLSPKTRVIVMTSYGEVDDVIGAMRTGAIDFITKPFDPETFPARVASAMENKRSKRIPM